MDVNLKIQPILIGADINCYSVARAFHEEYGVVSKAYGRYPVGATNHSKIIDFTIDPDINNPDTFIDKLLKIAEEYEGTDIKLPLFGCTDEYVRLIIENKEVLKDKFYIPYTKPELLEQLIVKESFYELCEKVGLDYPKTSIYTKDRTDLDFGFQFPVVVKPSDSVSYWNHEFEGMKKVYFIDNEKEFKSVIRDIYASGYSESLIIQEVIPGDDEHMRVLTCYSTQNAEVKMMCLGHVLLEEHAPTAIGNHAAIITEYDEELQMKIKKFLESIDYKGFSNFDIKYDTRDGKFKVFEINLRQGRSNYYVTGAGFNIAKYVVEDLILNKPLDLKICKHQHFWHVMPRNIVYKYVKNEELKNTAKKLVKEGNESSSLFYKKDYRKSPKRWLYLKLYNINQHKKFKRYCK